MNRRRLLQLQSLFPGCPSSNTMRFHCVDFGASIVVDRAFGFSHTQRHRAIIFVEETSNVYRTPHAASVFSGTAMHRRDGEFGRVGRRILRKTWMLVHPTASTNFGRSLPVPLIRSNIRFEVPTVDSQCHFTSPRAL